MSQGLAGAVVADTALSMVDGEKGELIYRGYDIAELGAKASFEEVVYLLWHGALPNQAELVELKAKLSARRELPAQLLQLLKSLPASAQPMAVLRTAVSALSLFDETADDITPEGAPEKALLLTASMPTIVAAWERIRKGQAPIAPRADLDHAANFLYMLNGAEPSAEAAEAVDAYLVLLADHGFNASTFATRVTTGTLADVYSAVVSGLGTLKGPAHGGATQRAMEQFIEASDSGDVAAWYKAARESGRRVMGIGHRVYKVEDPRAKILRPMAQRLAGADGQGDWFGVAQTIEQLTRQDDYFVERNLYANVDYYSAVVLYMIGLPTDQFTCLFAMSRIAGWTANVLEQLANNRLIRPRANYVGPRDLTYVPLSKR